MQKVTKAVIPCAGFGTRFLPATKAIPKEMFPIIDIPSLQLIVEECVNSGITDILIIISTSKDCIKSHFNRNEKLEELLEKTGKSKIKEKLLNISNMANIEFTYQYIANGTANAILLAKDFVKNEPFALLYGDDLIYTGDKKPVVKQLIEAYEKTGKLIVGCQTIPKEEAIKYGVIKPGIIDGRLTEVKGFVEKPKLEECPSTLASLGRYIITPEVFDLVEKTPETKNGEKYITDTIALIIETSGVYAYDFEGRRYDIGDKNGLIEAIIEYGLRHEETKDRLKKYLKDLNLNKT